jgi:hypothetical protein
MLGSVLTRNQNVPILFSCQSKRNAGVGIQQTVVGVGFDQDVET